MSEHVRSDIPFYVNGDLPESRRQQVEAHLAECESCRQLANRSKNKVARAKRQALKNAATAPKPNLLVARLGRQVDVAQRPSQTPWAGIVFVFLLLSVGAWFTWRHWGDLSRLRMPGTPASTAPVATSTDTVVGADGVAASTTTAVTPGDAAAVVSSSATFASLGAPLWSGLDSAIKDARLVVVRGRGPWRSLWSEMGGTGPAPRVNFDEQVVIGIFAGEKPAGEYRITFGTPVDGERAVTIPYRVIGSSGTAGGAVHPYALTTVPQTTKRIHFTQQSS